MVYMFGLRHRAAASRSRHRSLGDLKSTVCLEESGQYSRRKRASESLVDRSVSEPLKVDCPGPLEVGKYTVLSTTLWVPMTETVRPPPPIIINRERLFIFVITLSNRAPCPSEGYEYGYIQPHQVTAWSIRVWSRRVLPLNKVARGDHQLPYYVEFPLLAPGSECYLHADSSIRHELLTSVNARFE